MDSNADRTARTDLSEFARLIGQLVDDDPTTKALAAAYRREDATAFRAALATPWQAAKLPPDRCDPYVQVLLLLLEPAKRTRTCIWTETQRPLTEEELRELGSTAKTSDDLLRKLIDLGLISCNTTSAPTLLQVEKFAKDVCPPGTY